MSVEHDQYVVLLLADIEDALTDQQIASLKDILKTICDYRGAKGKDCEPNYYVTNTNEPYAHLVKEILDQNHKGVRF